MHALPTHPRTGQHAIGWRRPRAGEVGPQPIWPIAGGSIDAGAAAPPAGAPAPAAAPDASTQQTPAGSDGGGAGTTPDGATAPAADDKPLGPNGEKALAAERDARKALEKELAALAPLKSLAEALGAKTPDEAQTEVQKLNERLTTHETDLATERDARWRAEIATDKGLTLAQAARLVGKTRDELVADADKYIAENGIDPSKNRSAPRPDPTQGQQSSVATIDARIAEARKNGDTRELIRLKNERAIAVRNGATTTPK